MLRKAWWIAGCCMLVGCASLSGAGHGTSQQRPALVVERQPWPAGMLNPEPPVYGIDSPAGCIVQGEFRVEIDSLSFEPATRRLTMRVYVGDTDQPHRMFAVLVTESRSGETVSSGLVREPGLVLSVDPRETPVLSVQRIGYRSLSVDLLKLSKRAERRGPTPSPGPGAT